MQFKLFMKNIFLINEKSMIGLSLEFFLELNFTKILEFFTWEIINRKVTRFNLSIEAKNYFLLQLVLRIVKCRNK